MPSKRDIGRRIKSVKNTRKTTYAMKLVSASKLKKAQDAALQSREFAMELRKLLRLVEKATGAESFSHPLLEKREVRRIRFIVVGGSRGLAGGYNSNVQRKLESTVSEVKRDLPGVEMEFVGLGRKVGEYFRRSGRVSLNSYESLPEDVVQWPFEEICTSAASDFEISKIDEVRVIYTKFKSVLSMTPAVETLLPLGGLISTEGRDAPDNQLEAGDVLFEPSPGDVFASIVPRIFQALLRQAALDAKASEHASRMTAMDSATKNAGELIQKLTLLSNKLRQQKITSELLDIVGGAEAIK